MTRLLLTLLAVLTGLIAQVSPANARLSGASPAEVAVEMQAVRATAHAAAAPSGRPENVVRRFAEPASRISLKITAPYAPVMIGIDRARE
jgi:hypothetical protein